MKNFTSKFILFTLALFLGSSVLFSQEVREKKAEKKMDGLAYIDARAIYLELVEKGYEKPEYFKNLGDTYYWNSDYRRASEWYQKLIERFPGSAEPEYYYRAAQSLKSIDKYKESDKLMDFYAASGGDEYIIKSFKEDPDYLNSIDKGAKGYLLEKVEINTPTSDFGPTYYGDKLVYASAGNGTDGTKIYSWTNQPYLDLFEADMDANGILSNPRPLSGDINTEFHESSAAFTKDGTTVYFTRNDFEKGKKVRDQNKTVRLKLYRATKSGDSWIDVEKLPEPSFNVKGYSYSHPALSLDGKKLYFSSDMPGTLGMSDIWYVDILEGNQYGTPVNLGPFFNTGGRESFPYISKENNLYFSTDGRSGLGGFDIYYTKLDDEGKTGDIHNLGKPANSNQDDFGFIVDEEKFIGFLTSNRDGDAGSTSDEIYRVRENCVITIVGTVYDAYENEKLLPGSEVSLLDENNKLIDKMTVGADAAYTFTAECDKNYSVRGTKENYSPNEIAFTTPDKTGTVTQPIPLVPPCPPDDLSCILCIQPIFFNFDKWNIRGDAEGELAKVIIAMQKYPNMKISIESHTDSRATFEYNDALSERRAQSTLDYLVANGIDRSRLTAKGYGERQLLDRCTIFDECGKIIGTYDCSQKQLDNPKCSDGVDCSEVEHQLNRRSVFRIISN